VEQELLLLLVLGLLLVLLLLLGLLVLLELMKDPGGQQNWEDQ
jgi:hypothetical protein